jgi:hypothetical protein
LVRSTGVPVDVEVDVDVDVAVKERQDGPEY